MKEKKGEILVVLGCLLLITLTVSVAFFMARIEGEGKNIVLKSKDLKITFTESNLLSGTNIEPGWSKTSTFTVKNESKDTYKYNIGIKDLVNTFVTSGYLQYKITSADGGYNMSDYMDIPKSSRAKDKTLAYSIEIASNATQTYTVEFRYQNTTEDQSADMGKTLSGTLYIEVGTDKPTIAERILDDNPTVSTRTDFSTTFTTTNTGTLYKATESIAGSTAKDVYYFAGNAKNNWVKFGKQNVDGCRYKGDLVYKAIYANDGDGGYIEDAEEITDQNECEITGICATDDYGQINGITSSECSDVEGTWINKTPTYNGIFDIYWRIIRTNHDGSVRLLYSGKSPDTTSGYIGESKFNKRGDPMYVGYMYGTSGTPASNRTNENDSTIKTYIDNWYSNNLTSYTKYISTEAVYCNDREVGRGTYNTGGGVKFYYATYTRLDAGNPTYDCVDTKDAFSGSNTEAKLTYPIGLMTTDEILYAGGASGTDLTSPYTWYYTNSAGGSITVNANWWLLSPGYWNGYNPWLRSVGGLNGNRSGTIYVNMPDNSTKVRPVISIKSDAIWSKGDGSPDSPYEIVYN